MNEYKIDKFTSNTINIAKLIAIVVVCYVHSYRVSANFSGSTVELNLPLLFNIVQFSVSKVIGATAVPIFFIFSSILLYQKDFL